MATPMVHNKKYKLFNLFMNGQLLVFVVVGVSWLSGLVHWTQVLVLSECGLNPGLAGHGACVFEQDTSPYLLCPSDGT